MKQHGRYAFLDGLRGLAAFSVLLSHFTQHAGTVQLFASAGLAVDMFFCLSGFVIAHAYQGRLELGMGLGAFMRKRFSRLYPAYLVSCCLGVLALVVKYLCAQTTFRPGQIAVAALLNTLYLPFPVPHEVQVWNNRIPGSLFPVDDPAWSLFFELAANILFFFVVRGGRMFLWVVVTLSVPALMIATKMYGVEPGWGLGNALGGLPRVCFGFFAGVALWHGRHALRFLPQVPAWALILSLALFLSVPHNSWYGRFWLGSTLVYVPLLIGAGACCTLPEGGLGERLAQYWGNLSYPLYCVHFPILCLISAVPDGLLPRGLEIVCGVAVALIAAHVIHVLVERPMGGVLGVRVSGGRLRHRPELDGR